VSDLAAFRSHCRAMVKAKHRPDCAAPRKCGGCVTDQDRVWWKRLADEADRYLRRAGGQAGA
jgi:hypothetical protein